MTAEQLALNAPDDLPPSGARVAVTLPARHGGHFHGTVARRLPGLDGAPRADVVADPGRDLNSAILRPGPWLRPTTEGEHCPDCGRTDPGPSAYHRI